MRKIKILRIITRLNIGGPAIHAVLLTKELNSEVFESVLLCGRVSKGEGDMGYIAKTRGVTPFYVKQMQRRINPIFDAIAFFRIFFFILKYKPDIVHTHTAKAGCLGRLAAILAGVPVRIHTFHGHVFEGYFNPLATRFFIFLEKVLARFTDLIIAISDEQKDEIVNKFKITSPDKCRVVKLGFDLTDFLEAETKKNKFRKKFNFSNDDILIGTVGRLTAIKNHRMFIDACADTARKAEAGLAQRMRFIIIGDGELKRELLDYARTRATNNKFIFTGWLKDLSEAYADLDIVALTSINEGTPVSLIEAMAASKPVLATDVGGVRGAVGGAGVLVKSGDYRAMSERLLELAVSKDKRAALGALGRNLATQSYAKERLTRDLTGQYSEFFQKKTRVR